MEEEESCPPECCTKTPCDDCSEIMTQTQHQNDMWDTEELLLDAWEYLKGEASARGLSVFDSQGYHFGHFMEYAQKSSLIFNRQ